MEDIIIDQSRDEKYVKEFEPYLIDLLEFNGEKWNEFNRKLLKKYKFSRVPKKSELSCMYRTLLIQGKIDPNELIEDKIISKKSRGNSGILAITIATKPDKFSCKFNCAYCPNEPNQPRSYLSDEPVLERASQCNFDVIEQFQHRAKILYNKEHKLDKLEIIVVGGTWSCYDICYQEEFVRDVYYASNTIYDSMGGETLRSKLSLEEEQLKNEVALCRIISLTFETRPDMITPDEIKRLRKYGCTRIQIGIQHTNDTILQHVHRGCYCNDIIMAIKLLKDNGFKIDAHLMPNLPGSTPEEDVRMFEKMITLQELQVDQWKIYPCEVVKYTQIYEWFIKKEYIPYPEDKLKDVIKYALVNIPPYIRINRIIRDILMQDVVAGIENPSLHDIIQREMDANGMVSNDIRCREVKTKMFDVKNIMISVRKYDASGGIEYFISHESFDGRILYSLLRLRINGGSNMCVFPELIECAMIRELRVYGQMIEHNKITTSSATQHRGLGTQLIAKAEEISRMCGFKKIAVISGVGVNQYYSRKFGFTKVSYGYFVKNL